MLNTDIQINMKNDRLQVELNICSELVSASVACCYRASEQQRGDQLLMVLVMDSANDRRVTAANRLRSASNACLSSQPTPATALAPAPLSSRSAADRQLGVSKHVSSTSIYCRSREFLKCLNILLQQPRVACPVARFYFIPAAYRDPET